MIAKIVFTSTINFNLKLTSLTPSAHLCSSVRYTSYYFNSQFLPPPLFPPPSPHPTHLPRCDRVSGNVSHNGKTIGANSTYVTRFLHPDGHDISIASCDVAASSSASPTCRQTTAWDVSDLRARTVDMRR